MDWLTISWVMKISMNGCASTKKILMMNLFLTKNFCSKSIWCCQVSALVSFFRLPTPKFWWQTFSLGVSPTAQCFFFQKILWIAVVATVEIFQTQNTWLASTKNSSVCMDTRIRSIVKTFQISDRINAMSAKQFWSIVFVIVMSMTLNVPRLAIANSLIVKVTANSEQIL